MAHAVGFAAAILRAANLGGGADTTAAIGGQVAGAYYGAARIPAAWRSRLVMAEDMLTVWPHVGSKLG